MRYKKEHISNVIAYYTIGSMLTLICASFIVFGVYSWIANATTRTDWLAMLIGGIVTFVTYGIFLWIWIFRRLEALEANPIPRPPQQSVKELQKDY